MKESVVIWISLLFVLVIWLGILYGLTAGIVYVASKIFNHELHFWGVYVLVLISYCMIKLIMNTKES